MAVYGDYVRLSSASVRIRFETEASKFTLQAGGDVEIERFTQILISHDQVTEQTIGIYIGDGDRVGSANISGQVTVSNSGPTTHTAKTVTSASASMVAANSARKYLLIENDSLTGTIYVNTAGAAATVANGITIGPGESFEFANFVPTGQIFAIGDIGSNPNILVVEG